MTTKLEAAKLATASGVSVIIANGSLPGSLVKAAFGEGVGTLFPANTDKMDSRKRWLTCGFNTCGSLTVDDGAVRAIGKQNKSLLPAGILEVKGNFQRGDLVYVQDTHGKRIACGIANYASQDVLTIRGARSNEISALLGYEYGSEVVHRNNLVLI